MLEFSICTEEPLWILFLAYSSFDHCIFKLEYVLFYQYYAKITTFSDQEKFSTAPFLYIDVETFRRELTWKWHQNMKNDVKTSKLSYWHHALEPSYTPHVRQHFLAPVKFKQILVGYARNMATFPVSGFHCTCNSTEVTWQIAKMEKVPWLHGVSKFASFMVYFRSDLYMWQLKSAEPGS